MYGGMIMKNTKYLFITSIVILSACAKEVNSPVGTDRNETRTITISARLDNTKAAVTEAGVFSWQKGDKIGVFDGSSFIPFTLSSGEGTATGEFTGTLPPDATMQKAAIYPYSTQAKLSGTDLSFDLPKTYKYSAQSTNAAMVAVISDMAEGTISLKHLAGILKFTYSNIPSGAAKFRFVVKEKKITGQFNVDISASSQLIRTPDEASASEGTVDITDLPAENSLTFYVPVPIGVYKGFFTALYDNEGAVIPGTARVAKTATVEISEATQVIMPGIVCGSTDYKTKKYGAKTWIVENCREKGDGHLGMVKDIVFLNTGNTNQYYTTLSEYAKARIGAGAGRYYTWNEAMTGIANCSDADNPYKDGYSGTDDMGNPFTLDGTEAGEYNIQIRGCCPNGYHIANPNDWWDLVEAIKTEYDVPDDFINCGYKYGGGHDPAAGAITKEIAYKEGYSVKKIGNVMAWLRGANGRTVDGGVWRRISPTAKDKNETLNVFTTKADEVGFNLVPASQFSPGSTNVWASAIGKWGYIWGIQRKTDPACAGTYLVSCSSLNFEVLKETNNSAKKTARNNVRCVKNY